MPVPIFDQPVIMEEHKEEPPKKEKFSGWSIFFSVLLMVVFILMGELVLRDLNKYFNPMYGNCRGEQEISALAGNVCDLVKYEANRFILHADFVVPFLILAVIIYLFSRKRKLRSYVRVLVLSYFIFTAWMFCHLVGEGEYFLFKHYREIGNYAILFTLALIFIISIILVQRKINKRPKVRELREGDTE